MDTSTLIPLPIFSSYENRKQGKKKEQSRIKPKEGENSYQIGLAAVVRGSGKCGLLYLAEPIDACSTLTNEARPGKNYSSPFVLIITGGCSFDEKVIRAQKPGFKAAIVYDNEESGVLKENL